MNRTLLTDSHMHTTNSPDGCNTPEEMVQRARILGMKHITITDHCEVDQYFTHGYVRSVPKAYADADRLRRTVSAPEVLVGIEIGQATTSFALCDGLLAKNDYDFVLASVHHLPNTIDFYKLAADYHGAVFLLKRYYAELLRVVEWGNFDVLAHVTYPMRAIEKGRHFTIPRSLYQQDLDRVLRAAVAAGKGIEVNTQGGYLMPDVETLIRFRELGGQYVTIGSDAHSADMLGVGLQEGLQRIKDAGFDKITYYRRRQPVQVALE
jgi:histidinol-phosphatase (PHP family)